jgi:uncharacterized protein YbjQ (UPF0145 family)
MGTCFYRTGWQSYPWGRGSGWLGGMGWGRERRRGDVRARAADRGVERGPAPRARAHAEEARLAGADAVCGVRLRRRHREWATGLIEFVVSGPPSLPSASASGRARPLEPVRPGPHKLVRHGYWPVGLVAGTTVAYVATGAAQQFRATGLFSSRQNQEMPDFTRGIYDARALAMARLSEQAHALHAHGVVGVTVEHSHREIERDRGGGTNYTDLVIEMHVLGTAVVEVERDEPSAGHVSRPAAERPEGDDVSQESEEYDPTSTAGVPEHGVERLTRMRDRSFFTSDLSVNEFLLVKAAGFEPLGLVVGTSIYHIGFQVGAWSQNQEMDVLTQAMYHARELAMTRMEEEADQLGAGRDRRRAARRQPPRVGRRPRRVHRHRDRRAPRRGQAAPGAERPPVHERPLRPGLLHADLGRLPARSGS